MKVLVEADVVVSVRLEMETSRDVSPDANMVRAKELVLRSLKEGFGEIVSSQITRTTLSYDIEERVRSQEN